VGEIGVEDARVGVRAAVAIEPVVAMRGPLTRYIDLLSRGIAVIPPREELAGHARRVRGKHLGRRGAEDAARADLDEACAVADACGATDLKAAARLALGVLHQASRRLDEAAQIYESVLSMSHGGERLRTEAMALANLAAIAHDSRKFDEALGLYEESLSLFDALGDERLGAWMRVNSAVLLQERGDRGEARARYTRAAEALTKLDDDRLLGFALTNLGMLDIEENELDGALANLEKARGLLARAGDITIEVLTIGRLAAVLAMRGRVREALGAAVLAERMASRYGAVIRGPARVMRAFVDVAQARAARESGNLVAAESALMAARARIREVTTAPEGGGLAVSAISDEVRAALRVLQAWMPTA
jgi:tetratricopeptide (TPR) repeat protein